jgi:hypothetical protein
MLVQVNLTKETIERVDKVAKYCGVSRSALLAIFIGSQLREMEIFLPLYSDAITLNEEES